MSLVTPRILPTSIDEAYLQLIGDGQVKHALFLAEWIRYKTFAETECTVSIGIGDSLLTAKTAGQQVKNAKTQNAEDAVGVAAVPPPRHIQLNGKESSIPEALNYIDDCIRSDKAPSDLVVEEEPVWELRLATTASIFAPMPIKDLYGVGRAASEIFAQQGVSTCGDCLQLLSQSKLQELFGKAQGVSFFEMAQGIDRRPIPPPGQSSSSTDLQLDADSKKTLTVAVNWGVRLRNEEAVLHFLAQMARETASRLQGKSVGAEYLTIRILVRHPDAPVDPPKFGGCGWCNEYTKRSERAANAYHTQEDLYQIAQSMWMKHFSKQFEIPDIRGVSFVLSKFKRLAGPSQKSIKLHFKQETIPSDSNVNVKDEQGLNEQIEKDNSMTKSESNVSLAPGHSAIAPQMVDSTRQTAQGEESLLHPPVSTSSASARSKSENTAVSSQERRIQKLPLKPRDQLSQVSTSAAKHTTGNLAVNDSLVAQPLKAAATRSEGAPPKSISRPSTSNGSLPRLLSKMAQNQVTSNSQLKPVAVVKPILGVGPRKRSIRESRGSTRNQPRLETIIERALHKEGPITISDESSASSKEAKRKKVRTSQESPNVEVLCSSSSDIESGDVPKRPSREAQASAKSKSGGTVPQIEVCNVADGGAEEMHTPLAQTVDVYNAKKLKFHDEKSGAEDTYSPHVTDGPDTANTRLEMPSAATAALSFCSRAEVDSCASPSRETLIEVEKSFPFSTSTSGTLQPDAFVTGRESASIDATPRGTGNEVFYDISSASTPVEILSQTPPPAQRYINPNKGLLAPENLIRSAPLKQRTLFKSQGSKAHQSPSPDQRSPPPAAPSLANRFRHQVCDQTNVCVWCVCQMIEAGWRQNQTLILNARLLLERNSILLDRIRRHFPEQILEEVMQGSSISGVMECDMIS